MSVNDTPKVSVISPYAGGEGLPYFLQSMLQQTLNPSLFELILVEDGDHDSSATVRLFNFRFRVTVIPFKRPANFRGHSAGLCRNVGARLALGRTLVFADSDCILHPACIWMHYEAMGERPDLALYGALKELPAHKRHMLEQGFYETYDELSQACRADHRKKPFEDDITPTGDGWDFWYSGNASVARSAFLQVGGFDDAGHRCHDLELAYRLFKSGLKFEYLHSAEALHIEHPRSMNSRKEQMDGLLYIGKKHRELQTFAEDRFILGKRLLEEMVEHCESKFQQIIHDLPGVRAGFSWVLAPGISEESLASHLTYVPFHLVEFKDNVRVNLRLQRSCWDYNIVIPAPGVVERPEISVILPVYNGRYTIPRAVQSVFLQTCQAFELIVVDDASADGTIQEIEPYRADPRVRVISLRENHGLSNALNVGLETSQAPFIVQLDADDWLEPTALETILKHFMADGSVGAVYGDGIVHDADGHINVMTGQQLLSPVEFFEYPQCQVPRAFRKSALIDSGGWTVSDALKGRYYEDRVILAKIAETHKVVWIPQKLYHVEERRDSLYRSDPLASAAAKLPILWEQAARRGYELSYNFDGKLLRGKFQPKAVIPPNSRWSVIIPFHRSLDQLRHSLRSWLESDLIATTGELIIVDDGSDEDARELVGMSPERIRVHRFESRKGPARARNVGASLAQYEMLFFSDADHIVPPSVLSSHEQRHRACPGDAIVVGAIFGRRTFLIVEPDCRLTHKQRLLDVLRFDSRFDSVAAAIACGGLVNLTNNSDHDVWTLAQSLSFTENWLSRWAPIFIAHGERLEGYLHRWTRVNTGSMSISAKTFRRLGAFDEGLFSMEDWDLGARAQKSNVEILCAPEAEPYHQIHPVDSDRWRNDEVGAHTLSAKHGNLIKNLLDAGQSIQSPAALPIGTILRHRERASLTPPIGEEQLLPDNLAGGYCALTFDDGPHPLGTPLILEMLERFNCKATFFFLGSEAKKYPELCLQVASAGHEVGVHGWVHTSAEKFTTAEHFDMMSKAVRVIEEACDTTVRYIRPPYGNLSASLATVADKLGLQVVGWDVSAEDYSAPTRTDLIKNLASQGIKNQVLLFHDGAGDAFVVAEALDWLLKTCSDFGIQMISLQRCAQFRKLPSLMTKEVRG